MVYSLVARQRDTFFLVYTVFLYKKPIDNLQLGYFLMFIDFLLLNLNMYKENLHFVLI